MSISNAVTAASVTAALVGLVALAAPAAAQVTYQPNDPFLSDPSPYDQAYGTRPSFVITPTPNPYAPAVRVVERCMYPNGWNVTDFSRDVNGIPPDVDHTCPATTRVRVRARY